MEPCQICWTRDDSSESAVLSAKDLWWVDGSLEDNRKCGEEEVVPGDR